MKDLERDDLFRRAREAASPGEDDQRRVRAALRRRLGVTACLSVGVTGAKAAASLGPTGLLAGVGASGLALAKVATVLVAVAAVGLAVVPARRHRSATPRDSSSAQSITRVTPPPSPPPIGSGAERDIPAPPTLASPSATSWAPPRSDVPDVKAVLHALPGTHPVATADNHAPSVSREPRSPVGARNVVDTGAEVELVAGMQAALREGDTSRVLDLVREHERRFPASAWAPEREGARVLALCTRVRVEAPSDARSLGETFLDTHPLSPLGARVRSTCDLPAEKR